MTIDDAMELLRQAMERQYEHMLPEGFGIYKIAEYDPKVFPAPNLWYDKKMNPAARYLVILHGPTSSVPALGETVSDAITAAIAKVHEYHLVRSVKQ